MEYNAALENRRRADRREGQAPARGAARKVGVTHKCLKAGLFWHRPRAGNATKLKNAERYRPPRRAVADCVSGGRSARAVPQPSHRLRLGFGFRFSRGCGAKSAWRRSQCRSAASFVEDGGPRVGKAKAVFGAGVALHSGPDRKGGQVCFERIDHLWRSPMVDLGTRKVELALDSFGEVRRRVVAKQADAVQRGGGPSPVRGRFRPSRRRTDRSCSTP